jgi:hypothetical protein
MRDTAAIARSTSSSVVFQLHTPLHRDSADIRRQVEHAAGERDPAIRAHFRRSFALAENA